MLRAPNHAGRVVGRAGERAASMAEQLALDQLALNGRAVERHEGPAPDRAALVDDPARGPPLPVPVSPLSRIGRFVAARRSATRRNLEHLRRPEHRVVVAGRRLPWPQLEIAFGQLGVRCRIPRWLAAGCRGFGASENSSSDSIRVKRMDKRLCASRSRIRKAPPGSARAPHPIVGPPAPASRVTDIRARNGSVSSIDTTRFPTTSSDEPGATRLARSPSSSETFERIAAPAASGGRPRAGSA